MLIENLGFSCYIFLMSVTQTVDIPASRRITIDVPPEVPPGKAVLTFSPAGTDDHGSPLPGGSPSTVEEAYKMAAERAADPNRKPISHYFGILSPSTFGDGVVYQRKLRNEWDD
jgi:hypothetical protein